MRGDGGIREGSSPFPVPQAGGSHPAPSAPWKGWKEPGMGGSPFQCCRVARAVTASLSQCVSSPPSSPPQAHAPRRQGRSPSHRCLELPQAGIHHFHQHRLLWGWRKQERSILAPQLFPQPPGTCGGAAGSAAPAQERCWCTAACLQPLTPSKRF